MRKKLLMLIASVACITYGCSKKENPIRTGNTDKPKQDAWILGEPLVNGTYKFINNGSGKALEVAGYSTTNGALVQQWDYLPLSSQQWSITKVDATYYRIINLNSGKALDVPGGATTQDLQLQQWDYYGVNSEHWKIEHVGFGVYKFINKASGLALTLHGGGTANGTKVTQKTYAGNGTQYWTPTQVIYKDVAATNFFRRTTGVVTMDGAESIALNDGRVLWTFGDSGLGPITPDANGTVPCGGSGVFGNTGVVHTFNNWNPTQATSILGAGNTAMFVSDPSPAFNWPSGGGVQIGNVVYAIYNINGIGGNQPYVIAKYQMPNLNVIGKRYIPLVNGTKYSRLVKGGDGYVYVFGSQGIPPYYFPQNGYVARFPESNPDAALTYWNGSTWTTNSAQASVIISNTPNSFSICKVGTKYVAFSWELSTQCDIGSGAIYVATSSSPTGPFSAFKIIHHITDRKQGHMPFWYAVVGHPEYINSNNELLVTYCINHYNPCLASCVNGRTDPDEYRPKALRIPLSIIDPAFN